MFGDEGEMRCSCTLAQLACTPFCNCHKGHNCMNRWTNIVKTNEDLNHDISDEDDIDDL